MPDGSRPPLVPAGFDWRRPDYDPIWRNRALALTRLRKRPELLPLLKEQYANDWHSFICDWMVTVDPRRAELGEPTKLPFLLFPKQEEFITWTYNLWRSRQNGLCDKSRDSGVTWLCVAVAVCMWLFVPGAIVGFGSRKEEYVDKAGDPKSIFWKIRAAIENLPAEFLPKGWDAKKHAPFMLITNPENGNVILGEAGDNIGRGNRTSIYFVDEAAHIERPELVDAALSETTNCRIDISTPAGQGNPFARKRHSGKVSVFTLHWRDDPRKDEEWYRAKVAQIDDPIIVAQELDISYVAGTGATAIPSDLIARAQQTPKTDVSAEGPRFLGVDVARFGKDESVLTIRRNRAVTFQDARRGLDTEDVSGWIREVIAANGGIDAFGAVCVDDIGVGGGVTDKLRRWYPAEKIVGVNVSLRVGDGRAYNLRAKLVMDAEAWLKDTPCHLPSDTELAVQLGSIGKSYRGGLVLIESKDDMRKRGIKSPDRADSFFLTFASPAVEVSSGPVIDPREYFDSGFAC